MPTIFYRAREAPRLGEWLRSTRRPRCAYFVVGIEDKGVYRIGGRVGLGAPHVFKLEVERRLANAPAEEDVIHPIYWDARGKKR